MKAAPLCGSDRMAIHRRCLGGSPPEKNTGRPCPIREEPRSDRHRGPGDSAQGEMVRMEAYQVDNVAGFAARGGGHHLRHGEVDRVKDVSELRILDGGK